MMICSFKASYFLRRVDTVHDRHLNVHQYQMEFATFPFLDGFRAIEGNVIFNSFPLHKCGKDGLVNRIVYKEYASSLLVKEKVHAREGDSPSTINTLMGGTMCDSGFFFVPGEGLGTDSPVFRVARLGN